jgi:hypothetical protein
MLTRLASLIATAAIAVEAIGPLAPLVRAGDDTAPDAQAEGDRYSPNGRVVETTPAPITVPAGGGGPGADPTIGGSPMFLPYTPPEEVTELADERTAKSRVLENPDGTFVLEMNDAPINYLDLAGNWQPINLALVPDGEGGLRVAATAGSVKVDTAAGELGVIELDGHRVSLSTSGYDGGSLGADVAGSELDANTVKYVDPIGAAADVWVRPVDIGLEFGATWVDATKTTAVTFVLDPGDLTPSVGKDGRSIVLLDEKGEFAGAIGTPIIREGSEDGPPLVDPVAVTLAERVDGLFDLTYTVDAAWLASSDRVFPVILDPLWCIGKGASGCDSDYSGSNNYDTFVYSASPDAYESGWTVLRTGYDVRSDDGGTYGTMRSLVQFGHPTLPDGAVIYDTDLQMTMCCKYGSAQGQTIYARRVTKWWEPPFTWNQFNGAASTTNEASATVPASGVMNWDVDAIVTAWYTRTNGNRKPDFGFLLRMANEGSSYGEVEYRRYTSGTAADRPLLRIWFTQPKVGIDFDSRLGPAYAPSAMVAGMPVDLPIKVENKTGSAHTLDKCTGDNNCWKVGYRWFDEKGNQVALPGGTPTTANLPADVPIGSTSSLFTIAVTPPLTVGQYTLRLDLVHEYFGSNAYASDFATAGAYYSRNKKFLTASSTRWTGSRPVARSRQCPRAAMARVLCVETDFTSAGLETVAARDIAGGKDEANAASFERNCDSIPQCFSLLAERGRRRNAKPPLDNADGLSAGVDEVVHENDRPACQDGLTQRQRGQPVRVGQIHDEVRVQHRRILRGSECA